MRSAMITVEILISIVILFLIIATSVTSIKQLRMVEEKAQKYETFYIAYNNVTEYLDHTICRQGHLQEQGVFSGMTYHAACKLVEQKRSYRTSIDEDTPAGNFGAYLLSLYKITLDLGHAQRHKQFVYYKTIVQSAK